MSSASWSRSLCDRNEIRQADISGIVIASVVPPLTGDARVDGHRVFRARAAAVRAGGERRHADPVSTTRAKSAPIASSTALPRSTSYGKGLPIIVVDFGTATTFDAISAKGEYLGGVICPGPQISADALFQRAAKLPRIDVRKPARVIGTNTVSAMQSGCSGATWTWSRAWSGA